MKSKFRRLFFLTLLLSIFIRFYQLPQNPEGFDQTEAAFGYNSYAVLKSGRDEYGKFLPLVLVSIGDYKLAGYMYWQIPFIAAFGLNEFSTRLSTATAGVISLLLVYYIVYTLAISRKLALLTFFFTGIAPWHIILSRMGYDPVVALMFYLASIAFFIRWFQKERLYLLLASALPLGWAILTYYAVWVLLPFTVISYWICSYKKPGRRTNMWYATMIVLLPLIMIAKLLLVTGGQRLNQDSTYQIQAYPLLAEQIREDQHEFPLILTRVFHNKLVFYPQFLLQNLFNNLSFDFLFLRGDRLDRRFYIPYHGVLYLWSAPFVLLGLLYFWKHSSLYQSLFLLGAIGVIFLGSSFSEFGSETERTLFAAPLFCFLISYGLITVYNKLHRREIYFAKLFLGCIGLLLFLNLAYFNHQYFWHANVHEPWGRNFGVHEMLSALPSLESQYQNIIIPDSTYIFFYFYNQVDPKIAWAQSANRLSRTNFLGLNLRSQTGNYLTMPIECPAAGKLHILYVCQGTKIPKNSRVREVIRYRDGQPAFIILEFTPTISTIPAPENVSFMHKYGIIAEGSDIFWKSETEVE